MEREYFGFSYSGELDSNFKVIWSENRILFKHLSMGSKMLLKKLIKLKPPSSYLHYFKSEGIEYCAKIKPLNNGGYSCDIHEKICEQELSRSELEDEMESIKNKTLSNLSFTKMILEYLENSDFNTDYLHDIFKMQQENLSSIYCNCHNIKQIFNNEDNSEFIPFQNYILKSWDVIQHVTRKLKDNFSLSIDIFPAYVKIDYSKFELAFFNLVKIILIHALYDNEPTITIKNSSIEKIEVSVEFMLDINYEINEHSFEMRTVKYLFKKLNGDFVFYGDGRKMIAKGFINAETTANINLVPEGRYIEVIDDPDIILKKRTSNRAIKLYETIEMENDLEFASDVLELSDVDEDDDIKFAKLFFNEVNLMEK